MKRTIIFFLSFLCLTVYTYGQNNPRIAVIPLNSVGISEQEASVMTELLETGLVNTESFQVIE